MAEREQFTSRWGLILAALGMAIGTGNIWRFPRILAKNGGGTFLIPWVIFLFLWSIPLLIVEFSIGKEARYGTVGAFGKFMGRRFCWMGAFVGFCTSAIMFYYSVVMGWCVKYLVSSVFGGLSQVDTELFWNRFISSPFQPVLFHFIAMALGCYIIYRGIVGGVERANRILIPSLFILLLMAAVRALTLPGAWRGIDFFFHPDWQALLNHKVWLEALSQSAWSTGAGWGLILTYAVYMKKREDVVLNSFMTGLGNNSASLLAGLAIFPTVFALLPSAEALEAVKSSGPANTGLTFIWIPRLFREMPAGSIFQVLFFLALTFAALSSLISMIELATRVLMDTGMSRRRAVLFVGITAFALGIPSAVNLTFFENQDWAWGVGLILSGMFFAVAAIKHGVSDFRNRLVNSEGNDVNVGRWFEYFIKYLIPLEFGVMITWWFYQSIKVYEPQSWWNPFKTYSFGTCIFQWGVMIAIFMAINKWMSAKTLRREE